MMRPSLCLVLTTVTISSVSGDSPLHPRRPAGFLMAASLYEDAKSWEATTLRQIRHHLAIITARKPLAVATTTATRRTLATIPRFVRPGVVGAAAALARAGGITALAGSRALPCVAPATAAASSAILPILRLAMPSFRILTLVAASVHLERTDLGPRLMQGSLALLGRPTNAREGERMNLDPRLMQEPRALLGRLTHASEGERMDLDPRLMQGPRALLGRRTHASEGPSSAPAAFVCSAVAAVVLVGALLILPLAAHRRRHGLPSSKPRMLSQHVTVGEHVGHVVHGRAVQERVVVATVAEIENTPGQKTAISDSPTATPKSICAIEYLEDQEHVVVATVAEKAPGDHVEVATMPRALLWVEATPNQKTAMAEESSRAREESLVGAARLAEYEQPAKTKADVARKVAEAAQKAAAASADVDTQCMKARAELKIAIVERKAASNACALADKAQQACEIMRGVAEADAEVLEAALGKLLWQDATLQATTRDHAGRTRLVHPEAKGEARGVQAARKQAVAAREKAGKASGLLATARDRASQARDLAKAAADKVAVMQAEVTACRDRAVAVTLGAQEALPARRAVAEHKVVERVQRARKANALIGRATVAPRASV